MSAKLKTRICPDCGVRELDKWQKKCSECRVATQQHCAAVALRNFRQTEKYRKYIEDTKEHRREYMREYMRERRARNDL